MDMTTPSTLAAFDLDSLMGSTAAQASTQVEALGGTVQAITLAADGRAAAPANHVSHRVTVILGDGVVVRVVGIG